MHGLALFQRVTVYTFNQSLCLSRSTQIRRNLRIDSFRKVEEDLTTILRLLIRLGAFRECWLVNEHVSIYIYIKLACHVTCGMLVTQPEIKCVPLAMEAWSPHHWTTRQFPTSFINRKWVSFCFPFMNIEDNFYKCQAPNYTLWLGSQRTSTP